MGIPASGSGGQKNTAKNQKNQKKKSVARTQPQKQNTESGATAFWETPNYYRLLIFLAIVNHFKIYFISFFFFFSTSIFQRRGLNFAPVSSLWIQRFLAICEQLHIYSGIYHTRRLSADRQSL